MLDINNKERETAIAELMALKGAVLKICEYGVSVQEIASSLSCIGWQTLNALIFVVKTLDMSEEDKFDCIAIFESDYPTQEERMIQNLMTAKNDAIKKVYPSMDITQ